MNFNLKRSICDSSPIQIISSSNAEDLSQTPSNISEIQQLSSSDFASSFEKNPKI